MLCFSCVENATWCMRGPSPPVMAVSCTVGLRRIHAAYTMPSSSWMSSVTRNPRSCMNATARGTSGVTWLKWSRRTSTLDVLDVVEELVREAERILHADRVADALRPALRAPLDTASELFVERDGTIEVLGCAHAVAERGDGRDGALAQDEVGGGELLHRAQVDGVLVLLRHDEVEHVAVELARRREVGHHELHVRAAQDVGGWARRRRDRVRRVYRCLLAHEEAGRGQGHVVAVRHLRLPCRRWDCVRGRA